MTRQEIVLPDENAVLAIFRHLFQKHQYTVPLSARHRLQVVTDLQHCPEWTPKVLCETNMSVPARSKPNVHDKTKDGSSEEICCVTFIAKFQRTEPIHVYVPGVQAKNNLLKFQAGKETQKLYSRQCNGLLFKCEHHMLRVALCHLEIIFGMVEK